MVFSPRRVSRSNCGVMRAPFTLPVALLVMLFGLGLSATEPPRALQDRDEDAGSEKPPPKYEVPACMKVEAYARYGAGAYDHIVNLDSSCEKLARCEVSTDVNPEVTEVEVPAGE